MCWGILQLPSSHVSLTRRTFTLLVAPILVVGCSWLLVCCDSGTKPSLYAGVWTGYLGFGSNDSGYNTSTISDDRTCSLVAEISGNLSEWGGAYTLRIEGEPELSASGYVLGDITFTRFRSGIDTTQTTGTWSGQFFLSSNSAAGLWSANPGGPFTCNGNWIATKQ